MKALGIKNIRFISAKAFTLVWFSITIGVSLWSASVHGSELTYAELSLLGSYSKTDYGNGAYATSRRWTAMAGYYLAALTAIEVSYTVSDSFFSYEPYQTSSINEQTLAASVVQTIVPRTWLLQPYLKGGGAQYNRTQSGTVDGVATISTSTKSPSGLLGGGLRLFVLRNLSLKVEALTYLPDFKISEAQNNISVQGGLGWTF